MYFEQFYLGCLAHASYILGSEGQAVVVDPQRDVDIYLKAAEDNGLKILYIFETHLHADFVSGHRELAARTGAQICIGAQAGAAFPHVGVQDGYELRVGRLRLRALATPGHTPESICLVITDEENTPNPWAVLTGDTLFIGDVGRPDLSPSHTPQQLAGMLYDSLHNQLMKLPDDVLVYPAHGAGSLCGRNMRAERSSTIGTERLTNSALQIKSREEFVRQLTGNLPPRPEYFQKDAQINREGAVALSDLPELAAIPAAELRFLIEQGGVALDVRPGNEFAAGHVPGSINIPLSGQFASWAGTVLGLGSDPVLIAGSDDQLAEARLRLARVGIEEVRGYLAGGVPAWQNSGHALEKLQQITVQDLDQKLRDSELGVLDVRRDAEWQAGHIAGAMLWSLDKFKNGLPPLPPAEAVAVHCKSGYRSIIACSLLMRAGYSNTINVIGGFDSWHQAGLPVESETPVDA